VSNTGNVPLTNVHVTDNQGVVVACPSNVLAPTQSEVCTGSGTATAGQYTNLGVAWGSPPAGADAYSADRSYYFGRTEETALQLQGPTSGDPGLASYLRTYRWSIDKTSDHTEVAQPGGSANVSYTVTVTQTGYTDSGWQLDGYLTLTSADPFGMQGVQLTDTVNNGGTCVVDHGTSIDIPAGSSVSRAYHCTWASAPSSLNGIDTGTATWDPVLNHTPNSSTQVLTPFSFGASTANIEFQQLKRASAITVTDNMVGLLGNLAATEAGAGTSQTYQYSRSIAVPSAGCQKTDNTALIVETRQTASVRLFACNAVPAQAIATATSTPAVAPTATGVPLSASIVLLGPAPAPALPLVSPLLAPEMPLHSSRSTAPVDRQRHNAPLSIQPSRLSAPIHTSSHSHPNAPHKAVSRETAPPVMLPRTGGAAA
jgi:hypothetical protein